MARVEDGRPYAWGRLHAALWALKTLAETGRIVPLSEGEVGRKADNPRNIAWALLRGAGHQVFLAREKGGVRAEAAAVLFADIAKLILPERMRRDGLGDVGAAAFRQGYEAQLAEYRKQWEGLVD
ncbi:hypothetical protein [Streptomyces sp. NPDC048266]|uniref:hypothetical protein n=1 Tax=unclassified Streptomyces TaxID=2593676 RepID=UPI0033FF70C5